MQRRSRWALVAKMCSSKRSVLVPHLAFVPGARSGPQSRTLGRQFAQRPIMKTSSTLWTRSAFTILAFAALTAPRMARADTISACGNMDIDADAKCSIVTQNNCTTQCAPASCEDACAAKLEQQCNTQCTASADANCTSSCQSSCTTQCTTSPPALDCTTDCNTRCSAGCSASCTSTSSSSSSEEDGSVSSSSSSSTDCEASCGACCDDHCTTQCVSVPTTADCNTKCNADCTGSCTGQANASCQEQCQESSYATCKSELANDCTTQCQQSVGAIFCNGSYVNTSDVATCVAALNAVLTAKLDATGVASCSGNDCTASGTAKASCSASPVRPSNAPLWAVGAVVLGAGAGLRRRTRRSSR
jgi:MYXO-CTERM domain-containing protein